MELDEGGWHTERETGSRSPLGPQSRLGRPLSPTPASPRPVNALEPHHRVEFRLLLLAVGPEQVVKPSGPQFTHLQSGNKNSTSARSSLRTRGIITVHLMAVVAVLEQCSRPGGCFSAFWLGLSEVMASKKCCASHSVVSNSL